jgi:hypothetical protein
LRPGEIPGTGSNHFECQVAAEQYFEDHTNVIFSKFDCNMRISGDLLREIETEWCSLDAARRHSVTFMPNVCWSAEIPDGSRSSAEIAFAWWMSSTANAAPFPMSFVSGSLAGAIEAGYTPPSLLSEDEVMFTKKAALLQHAQTCRMSSMIMKIFYPPELGSIDFVRRVYMPKVLRWYVGWSEYHGFLIKWLLGMLRDHGPVKYPLKAVRVLISSMLRKYVSLVGQIGLVPTAMVTYWTLFKHGHDPRYQRCLQVLCYCFVLSNFLNAYLTLRIHWRLYHGFPCLKFAWHKVLLAYGIFSLPFTILIPANILWTYFKLGLMNRALVHTANNENKRSDLLEEQQLLLYTERIEAI